MTSREYMIAARLVASHDQRQRFNLTHEFEFNMPATCLRKVMCTSLELQSLRCMMTWTSSATTLFAFATLPLLGLWHPPALNCPIECLVIDALNSECETSELDSSPAPHPVPFPFSSTTKKVGPALRIVCLHGV
ncbi:hypothetical protein DAEQUDRAFT_725650 [Daedalea quercina L-15889]|uniref:Uncharacterized protein n=1 Tax=Daedalea quercina L-15889 TaxID=1314783 RepID=A0A165R6B6_9APHY|nr:hypothetical protein DAEQUDRAFT_725650 [Daedalea quercina L-15889]